MEKQEESMERVEIFEVELGNGIKRALQNGGVLFIRGQNSKQCQNSIFLIQLNRILLHN